MRRWAILGVHEYYYLFFHESACDEDRCTLCMQMKKETKNWHILRTMLVHIMYFSPPPCSRLQNSKEMMVFLPSALNSRVSSWTTCIEMGHPVNITIRSWHLEDNEELGHFFYSSKKYQHLVLCWELDGGSRRFRKTSDHVLRGFFRIWHCKLVYRGMHQPGFMACYQGDTITMCPHGVPLLQYYIFFTCDVAFERVKMHLSWTICYIMRSNRATQLWLMNWSTQYIYLYWMCRLFVCI